MNNKFLLYTDGSCLGNPGPGGWGVYIVFEDLSEFYEGSGGASLTTNNRMEMLAVVEGLLRIPVGSDVVIYTDSQYVKKGMEEWLSGWKKRSWKTASGGAVKNKDLWQKLDALCQGYSLQWKWVRGHTGDPGNEKADTLARTAAEKQKDCT